MFTFRCQGCGKQHVVEKPFEQDYATKCLRCGERVRVTRATIHGAGTPAPTRRRPDGITAKAPKVAAATEAGDPAEPGPATETAPAPAAGGGDDYEPPAGEIPLADAELSEGLADEGGAVGRRTRPPAAPRTPKARRDGTTAEEELPETESAPEKPVNAPLPDRLKLRERWPMVAGAAVLLVALIGGGCYVLFSGRSAKPPVAKETPKPKPPAPPPPPATNKESEKPAPPPLATKGPEVFLAATRLSNELAADAAATNARYKEKLLEVSGLFDKIAPRESGPPPARSHVFFLCEGGPAVSCDILGSPTDLNRWRQVGAGRPCSVRGTYRADGVLYNCELVTHAAPADAKYKGQAVEVAGTVQSVVLPGARGEFPGLILEGDADSLVRLECYFRGDEQDQVKRLRPTDYVTVRGTCGGRAIRPGARTLRLDNCELVYTSVPAPPAVRRDAIAFLREYEEDLRPFFLPAPGAEPRVEGTLTVARLNAELAADPAAPKYRNKVVTVTGKLAQQGDTELVLRSGNTDEPLKVVCVFTRQNFEDLRPRTEYAIRGRWVGLDDEKRLRLVCCESADPAAARDRRRVTPDYLPHRAERQLTYDVAEFPTPPRKDGPVLRLVMFQREAGNIETVVTHSGRLVDKSLFDAGNPSAWVDQKKTTRQVRVAGPTFRQRISGTFIEVGTVVIKPPNRQEDVTWDQVLKLGGRAGDTWAWTRDRATHEFTIEGFDDEGGRPRVVVKEVISSPLDLHNRIEKRHVYVRDVGEVEEREWKLIGAAQRVLVGEKRLVENDGEKKAPAYVPAGPPPPQ